MADNNLTPEQDLMFRAFFKSVANDPQVLVNSPAHRRQILAICLEALNYMPLPNGNFVDRATKMHIPFGSTNYDKYPDEWADDEERAHEAINSTGQSTSGTSSESKDTEVREAVLSEDV